MVPNRAAEELLADAALKALLRKSAYGDAMVHVVSAIQRLVQQHLPRDHAAGSKEGAATLGSLFRSAPGEPSEAGAHSSTGRLLDARKDAVCGGGRHVCDHTNLLAPAAYKQVDSLLGEFESQYRLPCGTSELNIPIRLAVTDTAKPYSTIGEYAKALYQHMGLGQQACDVGILVVFAMRDRQNVILAGKVRGVGLLRPEPARCPLRCRLCTLRSARHADAIAPSQPRAAAPAAAGLQRLGVVGVAACFCFG